MEKRSIQQLAGMNDLPEAECSRIRQAQEKLQSLLAVHDYRIIDTPLLEETELFLRKAGGEIGERLYTFTDPGGHRVSLRPEFTSSIIRYYLQEEEKGPLPLRWQYAGPVFRFEPLTPGVYRQFTQVGAELFGAAGPQADAEVLSLAWYGLSELGLSNHQLHIGHIGVIQGLLEQYHLSERAIDFLVASMAPLRSGDEGRQQVYRRGEELGLLGHEKQKDLGAILDSLDSDAAQSVVKAFIKEGVANAMGRRTAEEIFQRFLRKVQGADDPVKVETALDLLSQLSQVKGSPQEALETAKEIARGHGLEKDPLDQVEHLVQALKDNGLDSTHIDLDFGLARGIAYYSGVIFDLFHPRAQGGVSLGGGGRYDGLVRVLGGREEVPALGFAYNIERILGVLDDTDGGSKRPTSTSNRTLLVPETSQAYPCALRVARDLRSMNRVVRLGFTYDSLHKSLEHAELAGMDVLVVVDEKGQSKEYPIKARAEDVAISHSQ